MIARQCDNCRAVIQTDLCIELTIRAIRTDAGDDQEGERKGGEYCTTCLTSGGALDDLVTVLSEHEKQGTGV